MYLGSFAAEVPVKLQYDTIILKPKWRHLETTDVFTWYLIGQAIYLNSLDDISAAIYPLIKLDLGHFNR